MHDLQGIYVLAFCFLLPPSSIRLQWAEAEESLHYALKTMQGSVSKSSRQVLFHSASLLNLLFRKMLICESSLWIELPPGKFSCFHCSHSFTTWAITYFSGLAKYLAHFIKTIDPFSCCKVNNFIDVGGSFRGGKCNYSLTQKWKVDFEKNQ